MRKICLVFWESEPQYAYQRYAYKKNMYLESAKRQHGIFGIGLRHF